MSNEAIIRACLGVIVTAFITASAIGFQSQKATYIKGVVTQSKKPLRSVWVIASQAGQERGRYLTGDDGKFYISNLPSGDCDLAVWQGKQQIYSGRISLPGNNIFNITITPPKAPLRRKPRG
jgi:hypothetical protein